MKLAKLIVLVATAGAAAPLLSYVTFGGAPKWAVAANGFHYTVDLVPLSFPANSTWDLAAQYALSDWRDIGATSFKAGYTRNNTDINNHADGRNAWAWVSSPTEKWLGVTFVRYTGAAMTDCDIWFNSRPDYTWATGVLDPTVDRPYWPVDFRGIARHEAGHAIGLDHEDRVLDNMNSAATHGSGVQHGSGSGMLPHADDKFGGRALYPGAGSVTNLMATRWREPSSAAAGAQWLNTTGTWAAGGTYPAQMWLENQGNTVVNGGPGGVRCGLYLSTDAIISVADTLIGEVTFAGNWPAHASGPLTMNGTVPRTQAPGNYYVGAVFDNTGLVAEQFEGDNYALLGQVTVTNNQRALSIGSTNPASNVTINVTPLDIGNAGDGATPFTRTYWDKEVVSLTAPPQVNGQPFRLWRVDGVPQTPDLRQIFVTMTANRTVTAEYKVRVPGSYYAFGASCQGSPGVNPSHFGANSRGYPFLGEYAYYSLVGTRLQVPAALLMGVSNTKWGGLTLPYNLSVHGVTGCVLYTSLDVIIGVMTTNKADATVPILVPANYSLLGGTVYSQYIFVDYGAPRPLQVTMTNGLRSVIGGDL